MNFVNVERDVRRLRYSRNIIDPSLRVCMYVHVEHERNARGS